MGRIQSSVGLVTGTNIVDTVNQLIAISAQPRDRLTARLGTLQRQQTAIAELTASVIGVQLAGKPLGQEAVFQSRKATSSATEQLSATVSPSANVGSYNVRTLQLASTHTAQSQRAFNSASADLNLAGELRIGTGGFLEQTTNLSDLNQGLGVERGSIQITDRSGKTATIDLSKAQTIDDVLDAINENPEIRVRATADADRITLTDLTGQSASNLRVREVGDGETAADLGLFGIDAASNQAAGSDLNPPNTAAVRRTPLSDFGIRFADGNDLALTFADGSTLNVDLNADDDETPKNIGELLDALNAAAPTKFSASLSANADAIVLTDLTTGSGTLSVADSKRSTVASSLRLDRDPVAGTITSRTLVKPLRGTLLEDLGGGNGLGSLTNLNIQLRDGSSAAINLSTSKTIQQVADAINASGLALNARLDDSGTALRIRDLSGGTSSSFVISSADATAASLGIENNSQESIVSGRNLNKQFVSRSTLLADLNQGRGVGAGSFTITDSLGTSGAINVTAAKLVSVGDLIDEINSLSIGVEASINEDGSGIQLVDNAGGGRKLKVVDVGSAKSATALGIVGESSTQTINGQSAKAIVGGEFEVVRFTATDSLDDIAKKINDTSRFGKASVVSDGSGRFRLQIQSQRGGDVGRLSIDSTNAQLGLDTTSRGQDAKIAISGDDGRERFLSSTDGVFDDATSSGLTLTLKGLSEAPITVGITKNPEAVTKAAQTFVDQYNKLADKLASLTAFNQTTNEVGLLFGSSEALRINLSFGRLLSGQVSGAGSIKSFAQVGIRLNDQGKLTLDSAKLTTALDENPEAVTEFFTKESTGAVAQIGKVADRLAGVGNSLLLNRGETITRQLERGNERVSAMNERLANERERLLDRFYSTEQAIAKIQSNQNAVSSIQRLTFESSSS